jgi:hypothetical protein
MFTDEPTFAIHAFPGQDGPAMQTMIRREITDGDGTRLWLFVSQVHHAEMSGELVRHWRELFTPEVVEAIAHHDDGWAEWEANPKINPATGTPYSFLEMPLVESLPIWDRSIAAARKIGPLAGYIVAGHFYNLLNDSDHAGEGPAIAWLTSQRKFRTSWIDEWLRADPANLLDYARHSQQMLGVADLFSLWLCCDCPVDERQSSVLDQSVVKPRVDTLRGQFRFSVNEFMVGRSERADRFTGLAWKVAVEPYPFRNTLPALSLRAIAAPARAYPTWQEVASTAWPVELAWQVVPAAPPADGQTLWNRSES